MRREETAVAFQSVPPPPNRHSRSAPGVEAVRILVIVTCVEGGPVRSLTSSPLPSPLSSPRSARGQGQMRARSVWTLAFDRVDVHRPRRAGQRRVQQRGRRACGDKAIDAQPGQPTTACSNTCSNMCSNHRANQSESRAVRASRRCVRCLRSVTVSCGNICLLCGGARQSSAGRRVAAGCCAPWEL